MFIFLPQANTDTALTVLYKDICSFQAANPKAALIIAGDFNKANLKKKTFSNTSLVAPGGMRTLNHSCKDSQKAIFTKAQPINKG